MEYDDIGKEVLGAEEEIPQEEYKFDSDKPWKKIIALLSLVVILSVFFIFLNPTQTSETENIESTPTTTNLAALKVYRGNTEITSFEGGFINGVEKSLKDYGSWKIKSTLSENDCYHLYVDRDTNGVYVGVKQIDSWIKDCHGDTIKDDKFHVKHLVNLGFEESGDTCVCGEKEVNIETALLDYGGTNKILNLRISD